MGISKSILQSRSTALHHNDHSREKAEQTDCHDNDEQSRKKNDNNHKKLLTGAFNNIMYNWGIF